MASLTESRYDLLEFNTPKFLENTYGIKIFIGTKGEDDWCVSIPKELVKKKLTPKVLSTKATKTEKSIKHLTDKMREEDYVLYNISEGFALMKADEWTRFAKGEKEDE